MSPPSGHQPFLRAICESPDDDAPRLVFADWLDEHGDAERAEFIRTHIHLARNPDDRRAERRCEELFRVKGRAWVAALPGTTALWAEFAAGYHHRHGATRFQVEDGDSFFDTWIASEPAIRDWERGFPSTVYVQGAIDLFLDHAKQVNEFVPVRRLRLLYVDDADSVIQILAGVPLLGTIRDLIIYWAMPSDDAVIALANSPYAAGLRYISLEAGRLTGRGARALADSPNLGAIEVLHLLHSQFGDSARARLRARFGFAVHC